MYKFFFDSAVISIPYGAIKSPKEPKKSELFEFISIPYGAIKRKKVDTNV